MAERNYFRNPEQSMSHYWYKDEFGIVEGRKKTEIIAKVRAFFIATKRELTEDPFNLVMHCMCPSLPKGICTGTVGFNTLTIDQIKDKTRGFFPRAMVPYEDIERRLATCTACPKHARTFCPGCTGYTAWIEAGFRGRRKSLPVDQFCGVCTVDHVFVSAAASVVCDKNEEIINGTQQLESCWRR